MLLQASNEDYQMQGEGEKRKADGAAGLSTAAAAALLI